MNPPLLRAFSDPLERLLKVRPGEGKVLLLATSYSFFLMMGYYLLRPLREAMGIAKEAETLPKLITATLIVMFLVNPAFSGLVSRLPRRRFIPWTYRFFALNMLVFYLLFRMIPEHSEAAINLGYAFFVWLSVYNLFVVSIFWAFMADIFDQEQGKRLFGIIAIGGTLGAIAGAYVTGTLSKGLLFGFPVHVGPGVLILVSIVFLEAAVQCVNALSRHFQLSYQPGGSREPGPGVFEGLRLIFQSRFLALICLYVLLFTVTSTILYVEQGHIIKRSFSSDEARRAAFAQMDLWGNVLTLSVQLLFTGRLIRLFGLRPMLVLLPLVSVLSFGVLWGWPCFAALAIIQVVRRGMHYAVDRPVREVLYITLGPGEKYKSKPFIDTFVYRGGDFVGAWTPKSLSRLSKWAQMPLPVWPVAMGLSLLWLVGAIMLGNQQKQMNQTPPEPVSLAAEGD